MRSLIIVTTAVFALAAAAAGETAAKTPIETPAQSAFSTSPDSRLRVGVLDLENLGKDAEAAARASKSLAKLVAAQGLSEMYDQAKIAQEMEKLGKKMPKHCHDPRCVMEIGGTLSIDRMIFGSVDINEKRCGVHLHLLDIVMHQQLSEVSVEGDPGAPTDSVLSVAITKLYGRSGPAKVAKEYFGPEVHHENQFYISSGALIGAGLIWGIINYVKSGHGGSLTAEDRNLDLSGIPASADQIPMFARPASLANAYVAASDDAYGVLYNPAGMAWVSGPEAILGYQYRFGLDNIAASFVNKATREIGFGEAVLYSGDRDNLLTEMYFVSAVAYKLNKLFSFARPVSLGMNVKLVSNSVNGSDPGSVSGSSLGAGLDFGLIAELSDQIRYGVLLRDVPVINRWKNFTTGQAYSEALATTLHMGGTFQVNFTGYSTTFLIAEGQIPIYADQSWKMAGGIEQEMYRYLRIRLGLQKEIQSVYPETPWKATAGFGINAGKVSVDGSYEYNTLQLFDVLNVSFKVGF